MYTIDYFEKHIDSLTDKLGSDLFPLVMKMERFQMCTFDFLRETTKWLEATQEISDDIKPLIKHAVLPTISEGAGVFIAAEPNDYYRLISIVPLVNVGSGNRIQKAKKVYIVKEGQRQAYERDPHRKPSGLYPHVYRYAKVFEIKVESNNVDVIDQAKIVYVKTPTFGNIFNPSDIIVDLPISAVEQICLKTADSLRFTAGDEAAGPNYQFNNTYGKRN
jgi:hypothetical protein